MKVTTDDVGIMPKSATSIPRPASADEARATLLDGRLLGFSVEELLVDVRANEAERFWLDQCSHAVSLYEEGNREGAALRAMVVVESCPAGSALRLSVLDDFVWCLDICIGSARLHAEEAVLDVSGDPFSGALRHQLTEDQRLGMARRDIV